MASKVVRAILPALEPRHHTEAQIEQKEAAAAAKGKGKGNRVRSPQEADEFGPWDSTEDEFGSWVDKRSAHHTEAQVAAKQAAAAKGKGQKTRSVENMDGLSAPTEKRSAEGMDELSAPIAKRHHTESQIAAKEAAAAKKKGQA